jgi:hypothetical protein
MFFNKLKPHALPGSACLHVREGLLAREELRRFF